jgi:macrodomain Ter protein organizer (MatP/YcbG family)
MPVRGKIRPEEALNVQIYCRRKLMLDAYWPSGDTNRRLEAEKEFFSLNLSGQKGIEKLHAWCEKWLSQEQRRQLNAAIRAKRKRNLDKSREGTKSVTLSHKAWLYLSTLAKRDKVTISDFLESRLRDEYHTENGE